MWGKSLRLYSPEFFRNRVVVRRRSGDTCEIPGCTRPLSAVDHIQNVAEGGTDSLDNLQGLCAHHHKIKTQAEAARGRFRASGKRPPRPHPGRYDHG